ncbi:MAG TPA: hypothetical protein VFR35_17410 [Actinoplanes sp.]|nr:hypothetical protein [Actinoplanes sp.]
MTPARWTAVIAVILSVAAAAGAFAAVRLTRSDPAVADASWVASAPAKRVESGSTDPLGDDYDLVHLVDPARTEVRRRDGDKMLATLTVGARTVVFAGAPRRFTDPSTTSAVVDSAVRVRIAPRAWRIDPTPDDVVAWLLRQLEDEDPPIDVLGAAMQYLADAPDRRDSRGVRYAGDADFGYVHSRDERDGADFYDFLEIPWDFPDSGRRRPSERWHKDLDCSGYLRLIYGYRFGIPLLNGKVNATVDGLPRTAASMAAYARSVTVAAGRSPSRPPKDLSALQPGDIAFFALHDDPALVTHSGIYIGDDGDGRMRFISSRGTVDGPSFGDVRGDSVLDSGYFGDRLRRVIRL